MPDIRFHIDKIERKGIAGYARLCKWAPMLDTFWYQFDDPEEADRVLLGLLKAGDVSYMTAYAARARNMPSSCMSAEDFLDFNCAPSARPGCVVVAARSGLHVSYKDWTGATTTTVDFYDVIGTWIDVRIAIVEAPGVVLQFDTFGVKNTGWNPIFDALPKLPPETLYSGAVILGAVLSRLG